MSGFDISPIGGLDPGLMRELRSVASRMPGVVQGPESIGPRRAQDPELPTAEPDGFAGALARSLEQVQSLQDDARQKTRALAMGEDVDLHDVMIAANKSEVAFNLVLEVRNKLVDAWEKLSRSVM
jgi:flagellar hook-basal body complex protein FliE